VAPVVVADASVLIALQQLDQLSLLRELFTEILVPPAVQAAGEAEP
jgi:predicted nucleic acid-binding protein